MTDQKYKFPIACCPLCHTEVIRLSSSYGPNHIMWQCSSLATFVDVFNGHLPHYQVEWDKDTGTIAQHVIVGQFYLDTFNTDYRTRISLAVPTMYSAGNSNTAKHIVTIPQIRLDTYDKLLERVKTLIIFS